MLQTVVCIPLMDGVVEFGSTEKVYLTNFRICYFSFFFTFIYLVLQSCSIFFHGNSNLVFPYVLSNP